MISGIKQTDFTNFVLNDVGVDVIRVPVTKETDNMTGDETLIEGTQETIKAYFIRRAQKWIFDKEGKIEGGDAFMMTAPDKTVNVNDIIIYDNRKYRVQDKILRKAGNTEIAISYNLFLIE